MSSTPLVSLLLPCYNEGAFIEAVLQNALAQDFPAAQLEILVIDGGSSDKTLAIAQGYAQKEPRIRILKNPDRYVPQAMNLGIRAARGDIIMRWDAHAAYPPNYTSQLVQYLQKTKVENVGGLWHIQARKPGRIAEATALVLSHPLGVGNAAYRLGTKEAREVDTVPFGCYPKRVFEQYGYYDERLHRNQDIELNRRIRRGGGRIVLLPQVSITYYARSTFSGLWKNNAANGEWVIRTAAYTGTLDALSLRHFAPLVFILGMFIGGGLGLMALLQGWIMLGFFFIGGPLLYFVLTTLAALQASWQRASPGLFLPLAWSFWTLHFSYGWGSLVGLFKIFRGV